MSEVSLEGSEMPERVFVCSPLNLFKIPNQARGTKTSALQHQRLLPVLRAFSRRHLLWARASQVPIGLTGLSEICCDSV